ncbi:MAG: hypothetical protein BroJett003_25380 [Planctomycetota bacterium]|nr:MAG: hypothetical protein BroJett003_25380 [Planctomycetota bacterium]
MAVLTALGVGLQQTQANFFIMHRIVHGPLPTRQYIPVDGEWTDYAAEWGKRFVKSFTNWADRRFSISSPPDPAAVTGAPWPWQAYDPVGPWSVVNLANGNLHTVIPIAAWPGVQFNLYHNSLGSHELASLGGRAGRGTVRWTSSPRSRFSPATTTAGSPRLRRTFSILARRMITGRSG